MNVSLLHNELISCGLSISGCDSSGNVYFLVPDDANLAPLILAAHGLLLTSDEALALKAALGEQEWLAYQECRKTPIRQQRQQLYQSISDPLFVKAHANAISAATPTGGVYTITLAEEDVAVWVAERENIRTNNPYLD